MRNEKLEIIVSLPLRVVKRHDSLPPRGRGTTFGGGRRVRYIEVCYCFFAFSLSLAFARQLPPGRSLNVPYPAEEGTELYLKKGGGFI